MTQALAERASHGDRINHAHSEALRAQGPQQCCKTQSNTISLVVLDGVRVLVVVQGRQKVCKGNVAIQGKGPTDSTIPWKAAIEDPLTQQNAT